MKKVSDDLKGSKESSVKFACTYAEETKDDIIADTGSEVNIMGDVVIKDLTLLHIFTLSVGKNEEAKTASVTCAKMRL